MKKNLILLIACIMVLLLMAGCSENKTGTDPQQGNNSASSAENMTMQVNESISETAASETAASETAASEVAVSATEDFDLMDEEGEVEWPLTGGTRLDKVIVGSHAENYTDWVILSHC